MLFVACVLRQACRKRGSSCSEVFVDMPAAHRAAASHWKSVFRALPGQPYDKNHTLHAASEKQALAALAAEVVYRDWAYHDLGLLELS